MRLSRRGSTRASIAAALVAVFALTGPGAVADPVTDDDVERARQAVAGTAAQVASIELRLAQQSAVLDEAWVVVAQAAEDYTAAVVAAEEADAAAAEAQRRADAAAAEVERARGELGALALEAYRSGGSLDALGAMLTSDGYDDYVARSAAINQIGNRADRAVQRFEAAEVVGTTLAEMAEEALAEAEDAAAQAQDALARAQEAQAAAEAEVARIAAEREALVAQLAQLRQTSVEVERARQAQLEAERQARADAAAQSGRPASNGGGGTDASTGTGGATGSNGSGGGPAAPPSSGSSGGNGANTGGNAGNGNAGNANAGAGNAGNGNGGGAAQPTSPPAPPPTQPPAPPQPKPPSDPYGPGTGTTRGTAEQGAAAVAWALQQVGKPYVYGASGPDSFDCSGLTMRAWQNAGLSINRTSRDQYRAYYKIPYDQMRPGDIIAWGTNPSDPGSVYHVAMFIGNGQMVEASRPGVPVRVTNIRWQATMPYAVRP